MKIYKVSEFVQTIRDYLQENIGPVVIQGEVTNFRQPKGNLVYFELKDKNSRVLCFMMIWELKYPLEDGAEIRVLGLPSLFKTSGGFHIRVQEIELVGEGALRKALEFLKSKLEKEGIFAPERKRSLPTFPSRIGLITSPDAAAYTDVLKILKNRWSGLNIKFYPVAVQGIGSISQIVHAFDYFNKKPDVEVIILTRGGGSLEDFQSFNSEEVVRAIFASKTPVVCGVGHERDWTLSDFVADIRASTPSNAAEIVVPDRREILYQILSMAKANERSLKEIIYNQKQRVNDLVIHLEDKIRERIAEFKSQEENLKRSFGFFAQKIIFRQKELLAFITNLHEKFLAKLLNLKQVLSFQENLLKSLNPQNVLSRGYSITFNKDNKVVKSSEQIKEEEVIKTKLHQGELISKIFKKE